MMYRNFNSKDYEKLIEENKNKCSIVEDKDVPKMWRIRYPDGHLSEDYYNIARARQHADLESKRMASEML